TDSDVPDADVVIATWWETAAWVATLGPAKGAKIHFVQGYETWGGPIATVGNTYSLPIPKIVISQWLENQPSRKPKQKPFTLTPNGGERRQFHAEPRGRQAVPTVGMFYARTWDKGTDIALQAATFALRRLPNLRLRVASNVPLVPALPLPPKAEFVFQ